MSDEPNLVEVDLKPRHKYRVTVDVVLEYELRPGVAELAVIRSVQSAKLIHVISLEKIEGGL